jgi:hypothetical protein
MYRVSYEGNNGEMALSGTMDLGSARAIIKANLYPKASIIQEGSQQTCEKCVKYKTESCPQNKPRRYDSCAAWSDGNE